MSNQGIQHNAIEYINNSINVEDIELNENDSCPICLENIDNGIVKYQCTHKYCSDCIKHWHNLCPLCRADKKVTIDNNTSNIIIPTKDGAEISAVSVKRRGKSIKKEATLLAFSIYAFLTSSTDLPDLSSSITSYNIDSCTPSVIVVYPPYSSSCPA